MKYLVDTDRVVDWLKGRADAQRLLATLGNEGWAISLITYGEVYDGIYYGANPQRHEQDFRELLRSVPVLPLNQAIMRRFARIRGQLRRQGRIIGDPDIIIGATALHYDLRLVTRNVSHFERIPELRLHQSR